MSEPEIFSPDEVAAIEQGFAGLVSLEERANGIKALDIGLNGGEHLLGPGWRPTKSGVTVNTRTALEISAVMAAATIAIGSALRGGEHFSIQHDTFSHRLYRIGKVTLDGLGNSVVTIRPPLREATAAGTRLELDYPKCIMKL